MINTNTIEYVGSDTVTYKTIVINASISDTISLRLISFSQYLNDSNITIIAQHITPAVDQTHGPAPALNWTNTDITSSITNINQLNKCGFVTHLKISFI